MKIYVVGGAVGYTRFLDNVELVDNLAEAEVVLFTGGSDVDPSFYNKKAHKTTYSNISRDKEEKAIFDQISKDQLVVGICRGSQFLCVMNGGILVQDCRGHAIGRTHAIFNNKETYEITSTHHQMQYPFELPSEDYDVLYTSRVGFGYDGDGINPDIIEEKGEPEIVLYHRPNMPRCLAIQGHPEMIPGFPVTKMLNKLIKSLC
jgi:GMP synthase-like glutamine amidotransferase